MAFITKIPNRMMYKMFNSNPQSQFGILNTVGGLNNRSVEVAQNEAMDLRNMSFYDLTLMEKRKGTIVDTSNPTITGKVTFLHKYKPFVDSNRTVIASDSKINFVTSPTTMDTFNVSGTVDGSNFQGKYFFTDGTNLFVYGTFPTATDTHTAINGTADSLYHVFTVVAPPSGFTPLADPNTVGVTHYDFANKKVWYEPCNHEITDSYKGAVTLPPNPKYVEVFKGRMYCAGFTKSDNQLYISDVNNPYYFPTATAVQLTPNGDLINTLAVYDDAVIIGRSHDVYSLTGDTNNPTLTNMTLFSLRKLNTQAGIASNHATSNAMNFLFFLGSDGNVYSLNSSTTNEKLMATTLITEKIDLFKEPFNFTSSDLSTAYCAYHNDFWYLSIKDFVLVYSFRHKAWTLYDSMKPRAMLTDDDTLIWGTDDGKICKFDDNGFLDQGLPYEAYWTSGWYDMRDQSNFKHFQEFYCSVATFDGYKSTVKLKFEVDYRETDNALTANNQRSKWGTSKFGDLFITKEINYTAPFFLGERGRRIRITFSNGMFLTQTIALEQDLDTVGQRNEGTLVKCTDTGNYYQYTNYEWVKLDTTDLNQPMRVYNIVGLYELRGKR